MTAQKVPMKTVGNFLPPSHERMRLASSALSRFLESQADPLARIDVLGTGEVHVWEGDQA